MSFDVMYILVFVIIDDSMLWNQSFGFDEALLSCDEESLSGEQVNNNPPNDQKDGKKRLDVFTITILLPNFQHFVFALFISTSFPSILIFHLMER
jgi:hypothetical protein